MAFLPAFRPGFRDKRDLASRTAPRMSQRPMNFSVSSAFTRGEREAEGTEALSHSFRQHGELIRSSLKLLLPLGGWLCKEKKRTKCT